MDDPEKELTPEEQDRFKNGKSNNFENLHSDGVARGLSDNLIVQVTTCLQRYEKIRAIIGQRLPDKEERRRLREAGCRPLEQSFSWGPIYERLHKQFQRWSRIDAEQTRFFQKLDPKFRDAKEGDLTQMVDENELVAKITNPILLGVDFLEEFSRSSGLTVWRWGWEVLVLEDGKWFRRRILNVGLKDKSLVFTLDSNRCWTDNPTKTSSVYDISITVQNDSVHQRIPPTVTRRETDWKDLPTMSTEKIGEGYFVIPPEPPKKEGFARRIRNRFGF